MTTGMSGLYPLKIYYYSYKHPSSVSFGRNWINLQLFSEMSLKSFNDSFARLGFEKTKAWVSIFRAWPEQNDQVNWNECLVPNPRPPHVPSPRSSTCLTWATCVLLQVLQQSCPQIMSWFFSLLISLTLQPACSRSDLHFSKENRRKRRGVGKEVLWEGQPAGALGGIWGHCHELRGSGTKWKPFKKSSMLLPISPTTSNSISAPRRKIKITFCGMKRWQWLWIQLCYRNLEITLPFEAR